MRIARNAIDLDAFRAFVESNGAIIEKPAIASGEVLRFRSGKAICAIAKRKDGSFALGARETRRLYVQFIEANETTGNEK